MNFKSCVFRGTLPRFCNRQNVSSFQYLVAIHRLRPGLRYTFETLYPHCWCFLVLSPLLGSRSPSHVSAPAQHPRCNSPYPPRTHQRWLLSLTQHLFASGIAHSGTETSWMSPPPLLLRIIIGAGLSPRWCGREAVSPSRSRSIWIVNRCAYTNRLPPRILLRILTTYIAKNLVTSQQTGSCVSTPASRSPTKSCVIVITRKAAPIPSPRSRTA